MDLMKFDPSTKWLDFGGDPVQDPDLGFLNPDNPYKELDPFIAPSGHF